MKTRRSSSRKTIRRGSRNVVNRQTSTRIRSERRRRRQLFFKRGGSGEDAINAIVTGIEIGGIKNALTLIGIVDDRDIVTLQVEKINDVSKSIPTTSKPVSFTIDNETIDFYIDTPPNTVSQRFVYIFLNGKLYGRIMLVINGNKYNDSYNVAVANAIQTSLIKYKNNKKDSTQRD